MKKTLATLLAGIMLVASLTACGSKETNSGSTNNSSSDADTYKIGVLQLVEHAALDASNEGFVAALNDAGISYEIDQQNAQNDQTACQTIAEKLVNDGNDLILAIATPAAQAVAGITSDIPVIGTAITDFAASGLVDSNDAPGGNVTGSSDLTPVEAQISLLQKVCPDAKTVGILYCSAESNSTIQVAMAIEACKAAGLAYEELSVASSNEIQSVVESAVGKVDCLYAPTDNTIASGMATVAMVANDNNLPIIAGEEGMVTAGALCTYSIDYYELGYLAGQMAVRILTEGANPADMPIEYYPEDKCTFIGNEDTAATLGIDISGLE